MPAVVIDRDTCVVAQRQVCSWQDVTPYLSLLVLLEVRSQDKRRQRTNLYPQERLCQRIQGRTMREQIAMDNPYIQIGWFRTGPMATQWESYDKVETARTEELLDSEA